MAAKKYYAVKRGKIIGVFDTWETCKDSVEGYSGPVYKGFSTLEEARAFLGEIQPEVAAPSSCETREKDDYVLRHREDGQHHLKSQQELVAYVDGSYNDSLKRYAFGCVFLLPDGRIFLQYGSGNEEQSLKGRNVTGEMLGAMYAVRAAQKSGYQRIRICYDYAGIENWVTGAWRTKQELTELYANSMRSWAQSIDIQFEKVKAHTNVAYNELADRTAKRGLMETTKIPNVIPIEEMFPWTEQ